MAYYIFALLLLCLLNVTVGIPCDERCGKSVFRGTCDTATGRCRCFWGWTGSHAQFVPGTLNVIDADHCNIACHYSHVIRNTECTPPAPTLNTPESESGDDHVDIPQKCHEKCEQYFVRDGSKCLQNGRCLCFWGWKGPNAAYVTSGASKGKIIADYCTESCHYTDTFLNPECLKTNP